MNAADLKLDDIVRIGDGEVLWRVTDTNFLMAAWEGSGQNHHVLLYSLDLRPVQVRAEPIGNLRPVDAITLLGSRLALEADTR